MIRLSIRAALIAAIALLPCAVPAMAHEGHHVPGEKMVKKSVTGEVVEVNSALKDKPETVNADPHASWMIVVKLTNPGEAGALLDATQYQDLVK